MMIKPLLDFCCVVGNSLAYVTGWMTITLIALSLYPPLSFIPKFFVLFALTH